MSSIRNNYGLKEAKQLKWSFWLSIISFVLLLVALAIGITALIIALKNEKTINLFSQAVSESKLIANTDYTTMYTYYTQSNSGTLKNYSGNFEVTVNNSSAIDFKITDENDNNLTGTISKGKNNLPTIIPFSTSNVPSQLKIKYKTNSSSVVLRRIDLKLD